MQNIYILTLLNHKMRLYVAGQWSKRNEISAAIEKLEAIGHTITHNWTKAQHFRDKMDEAIADVNGVLAAEAVIVFMDDVNYPYRGSWTEIGVALGQKIPIYMITTAEFQKNQKNVFFHHPGISKKWHLSEVIGHIGTPNYEFDPATHIDILKKHGFYD